MREHPWLQYVLAFVITALIFSTAIIANNYFNEKRIEQLRSIEEGIATDILSLETQFDLLEKQSCENIKNNPVLSRELDTLAVKLSYAEAQLGVDNEEVLRLKRQYSLLAIKDLLLMQRVSEKCDDFEPIFLLYFYSNERGACDDCTRQGYVLTELAREHPQLRIYAFDYDLDLSAIETLVAINQIPNELPALVINDTLYTGFQSIDDITAILPELAELREDETATTTPESTE